MVRLFLPKKKIKTMSDYKVGIVMGSDSDLDVMKDAAVILESFGIPYTITVMSAHRTPHRSAEFAHQGPCTV